MTMAGVSALGVVFSVRTAATPGAVGIIEAAGDARLIFEGLGCGNVAVGSAGLREICSVDSALVARVEVGRALIMPHGGVQGMEAICAALIARGWRLAVDDGSAFGLFSEVEVERLALGAIARAPSSLAIELLLRQAARWRDWDGVSPSAKEIVEYSDVLDRLLRAPLVALVGKVNAGKSSLTNAVASGDVSIVSEEAGTTRDHTGALVDLGGLVVRWVDTPGWRGAGAAEPEVERESRELAKGVIGGADLVLVCSEDEDGFEEMEARMGQVAQGARRLRIGTKGDLRGGRGGANVETAAAPAGPGGAMGLDELVGRVREELVPVRALEWSGPWAFAAELRARL